MKILFVLPLTIAILATSFAWAGKKEHRHHGAHEHGAIKIQIAFDQAQGQMVVSGAALPFLGFESEADEAKKKSAVDLAVKKFEDLLPKMVMFAAESNCKFIKNNINFVFEKPQPAKGKKARQGEHADIQVESKIQCEKSIAGTLVQFNFTAYPELKDVDIDFLLGQAATSIEIKNGIGQIQLKN